VALATGCTATIGGNNAGGGGAGTGTGIGTGAGTGVGTGSAGTGTTTGTAGSGSVIPLPPPGTCVPGIPATTQIPRMMNQQYENVVRDLLGVTDLGGAAVSSVLYGDFQGPMTAPAWSIYQDTATKIAAQVMAGANKSMFISCDPAAAGCLQTTVQTFGRKAFRRALTTDEVSSFMALNSLTPAGTPAQVAEAILAAFLESPSFLLLPELNTTAVTATNGPAIQLSPQEVATRLSFLLWGSVPDDTLNAAADANQLSTADQILTQATRMIAVRAKTGPMVSAFHDNWAQWNNQSGHWFQFDHDPAKYPTYLPAQKTTFKAEMNSFWEEVAFTQGSFQDLLLSNVAFVNQDNAAIYGLDPTQYPAAPAMTKVSLDSTTTPRPGFLTRAAFLSSYSGYSSTSPILRGAFMSIWLLSVNPGAPDPSFTKATVSGTFPTEKAYVEALTMQMQPCKGCHSVFNPLGFVMESYDGIGKWQTTDLLGGAIDASVTTNTIDFGDGSAPRSITNPVDLMKGIAALPKAQALYAQAWVSFATGRDPNGNDQCIVNQMSTKLAGGTSYPILTMLSDLTQSESFRLRVQATP